MVVDTPECLSGDMQPEGGCVLIYYKGLYFFIVNTNFGQILGDEKRW